MAFSALETWVLDPIKGLYGREASLKAFMRARWS